jgi:hypothetical protein
MAPEVCFIIQTRTQTNTAALSSKMLVVPCILRFEKHWFSKDHFEDSSDGSLSPSLTYQNIACACARLPLFGILVKIIFTLELGMYALLL